ncbi:distal tail protein Dit [Priestia megaterium]|uniref:distal tail protein Dit n=1 Tax=Priestia megaterium TaxID=1404 RepID=UPI0015964043|nr:distal tail protein Dit [Priestia megaterium]
MINFNGYDLSNDIRVTDVKRPVLPPSVLTTSSIVGRSGAFLFYKQFGDYTIPVSFMLIKNSLSELRQSVRDLAAKLDTNEPAKLIFEDEPDKYINAIVSDDSTLSETAAIGSGTINFYCPDPYWYAITDDVFDYWSTGTKTFTRKGTAESNPLIEILGTSSNGSLTLSNGTSTMTFTGQLNNGETLVLDSDLLTAYILKTDGTKVAVLDKLDNLDFLVLSPDSNTITISSSNFTLVKLTVNCRSRWK